MLVLSRKEGESIVINDDIVVTIVRNKGGVVRVGIEAPQDVRIVRSELLLDNEPIERMGNEQTEIKHHVKGDGKNPRLAV